MFDPHQLRVFIVAAETLNFSQAARKLNLSQPAVTQTIQSLEAQLGKALFHRQQRKLALTEEGQAFLPVAHQLVALNIRARELVEASRDQVNGQLIIACSTTPGKYVLPVILSQFLARYPRVSAQCLVVSRAAALEALESGHAQFAFSSSIEEFDHHYEFFPFLTDPVYLIAPENHLWARRGEIDLEELPRERFILREDTAGTYCVVKSELAKRGFNIYDLPVVLRMGNSEAIAIAVSQRAGVGFVSGMVLRHLYLPNVAVVRVRGMTFEQQIYMCRHRLNPTGSAGAAFWQFITVERESIQRQMLGESAPVV